MDYSKQKCANLDKILTLIKNNNPINFFGILNFYDEFDLENKDNIKDFGSTLRHYFRLLKEKGYIWTAEPHVFVGNLVVTDKGIDHLEEGGYTKMFEEWQKVKLREEKLDNLRITELEKKVKELEKAAIEQSDFYTTSTKRNRIQQWIIPLSFVISILALWVAYCK